MNPIQTHARAMLYLLLGLAAGGAAATTLCYFLLVPALAAPAGAAPAGPGGYPRLGATVTLPASQLKDKPEAVAAADRAAHAHRRRQFDGLRRGGFVYQGVEPGAAAVSLVVDPDRLVAVVTCTEQSSGARREAVSWRLIAALTGADEDHSICYSDRPCHPLLEPSFLLGVSHVGRVFQIPLAGVNAENDGGMSARDCLSMRLQVQADAAPGSGQALPLLYPVYRPLGAPPGVPGLAPDGSILARLPHAPEIDDWRAASHRDRQLHERLQRAAFKLHQWARANRYYLVVPEGCSGAAARDRACRRGTFWPDDPDYRDSQACWVWGTGDLCRAGRAGKLVQLVPLRDCADVQPHRAAEELADAVPSLEAVAPHLVPVRIDLYGRPQPEVVGEAPRPAEAKAGKAVTP